MWPTYHKMLKHYIVDEDTFIKNVGVYAYETCPERSRFAEKALGPWDEKGFLFSILHFKSIRQTCFTSSRSCKGYQNRAAMITFVVCYLSFCDKGDEPS